MGTEQSVSALPNFYIPPASSNSALERFSAFIEKKFNLRFAHYDELHRWSCDNYDLFWEQLALFTGIKFSQLHTQVIDKTLRIDQIPKWFIGSTLNYAENCLMNGNDDDVAIYYAKEGDNLEKNAITRVTFKELRQLVAKYAGALRRLGVKRGDCVVGYMPNTLETTTAMLATAAIGGIWSSTSLDFGHKGVLDRFKQISPKVMFSVDGVMYKNRVHDHLEKVQRVMEELPSLTAVVIVPFVHPESAIRLDQLGDKRALLLSQFLLTSEDDCSELAFEQVPFDHPLFIMFSSGTTGVPKAMVHSVGGTLLKHVEEHVLQEDMTNKDIIFFWTTCGWMMWNWLMTSLFTGAALVLYEGSPMEPFASVLFRVVELTRATIVGMGAKLWDTYDKNQIHIRRLLLEWVQNCGIPMTKLWDTYDKNQIHINALHDTSTIRMVLSTASPLKPQSFDFINQFIRPGVVIGSISGGTDIVGCFMGASVRHSVHRGEIQCLYLGMDMQAWNQGQSVRDERGELVCLCPFPSQPTHFLGDDGGERYKKAYFARFPGVWAHGDFCMFNSSTGGIVMLGRSDGTLNPGGVRFGSAELYNVVEAFEEIDDSIVVGQKIGDDDDERVVMFVKLNNGYRLDTSLESRIRDTIRNSISPKHVPAVILPIDDIPYTSSGKKVEVAVKQVENVNALRNPESLMLFEKARDRLDNVP